ncbi:MAG: alpha/beta hydrolase [Chloroflexota bacterium]
MRPLTFCLLALLLLVAPADAQDNATPTAPEPETVSITMTDDTAIIGDYYTPTDPPDAGAVGVLLLHMLRSDRSAWAPLIPLLHEAGYAVLAVDMRGHGATGGPRDWDAARADVGVLFDWLRERDGVRGVAVIGGSIGANIALLGCGDAPDCLTVAALSPGLDYSGVMPEPAVNDSLRDRAVLLLAAHGDRTSADAVRQMTGTARGEVGLRLYPGSAHGTVLLQGRVAPRVMALLVHWLNEHTAPAEAET